MVVLIVAILNKNQYYIYSTIKYLKKNSHYIAEFCIMTSTTNIQKLQI